MDMLLYTPLPATRTAPVACDYTLVFSDDPARTTFCSFTKGRCGAHNCPLNKFKDRPESRAGLPPTPYSPLPLLLA